MIENTETNAADSIVDKLDLFFRINTNITIPKIKITRVTIARIKNSKPNPKPLKTKAVAIGDKTKSNIENILNNCTLKF